MSKSEVLKSAHHSDHYKDCAIEPLEYIEANNLPWHEANVIKYVTRWKYKDGVDDLKKAQFYLDRLIERAEQKAIDING